MEDCHPLGLVCIKICARDPLIFQRCDWLKKDVLWSSWEYNKAKAHFASTWPKYLTIFSPVSRSIFLDPLWGMPNGIAGDHDTHKSYYDKCSLFKWSCESHCQVKNQTILVKLKGLSLIYTSTTTALDTHIQWPQSTNWGYLQSK